MEVHAHSHTERKKWTHYLWEFLMLFLAVFCGFLAENLREHFVEHKQELQYIRSMTEDIKSDTTQLHPLMLYTKEQLKYNDSVLMELTKPAIVINANRAYSFWYRSSHFPPFVYNDGTIQQLKYNSGLRLIRNKKVTDSIMNYDRRVRWLITAQQNLTDFMTKNADYTYRLFSTISHDRNLKKSDRYNFYDRLNLVRNSNVSVPLLNTDRKFVEEAYGYRIEFRDKMLDLIRNQEQVFNSGGRLITFIRKEYSLK
jgi:hypothetical protein